MSKPSKLSGMLITMHAEDVDKMAAELAAQQAEITRLVARVGELEAALRIYADPDNWFSGFEWDYTTPTSERNDGHEVAAQALANGGQVR